MTADCFKNNSIFGSASIAASLNKLLFQVSINDFSHGNTKYLQSKNDHNNLGIYQNASLKHKFINEYIIDKVTITSVPSRAAAILLPEYFYPIILTSCLLAACRRKSSSQQQTAIVFLLLQHFRRNRIQTETAASVMFANLPKNLHGSVT